MNKILFVILISISAFGTMVFAEDAIKPAADKKQRRLKINFEEVLVKGNAEMPDLANIEPSKNFNFKKLIKIRTNFIPEAESGGQLLEK